LISKSGPFLRLNFKFQPFGTANNRREITLKVQTSKGVCYWHDNFYCFGEATRSKEDFLNQSLLRTFMDGTNFVLKGSVVVNETDDAPFDDTVPDMRTKLVRDIHSLASSEILSDFSFIVEGRELKVHKAILAGE
jgi:hypothetical protein